MRSEPLPPRGDWRKGASAVLVPCFDVDAETPLLAAGAGYDNDLSAMSHQAYGPRVGVPRLLELLALYHVPGTFFVPGQVAERWPGAVERILGAGHEVALHGYSHRSLVDMTVREQIEDLEQGIASLSRLGVEPVGYRAPYWRMTQELLDLLPSYGFTYDSSLMDDDKPYIQQVAEGELAELPVHWSLDDWEQYAFLPEPDIGQNIEEPAKLARLWIAELDAMRQTHSLCVPTCHPFLSGRPSRTKALEDFLTFACEHEEVRLARADELANIVIGS